MTLSLWIFFFPLAVWAQVYTLARPVEVMSKLDQWNKVLEVIAPEGMGDGRVVFVEIIPSEHELVANPSYLDRVPVRIHERRGDRTNKIRVKEAWVYRGDLVEKSSLIDVARIKDLTHESLLPAFDNCADEGFQESLEGPSQGGAGVLLRRHGEE